MKKIKASTVAGIILKSIVCWCTLVSIQVLINGLKLTKITGVPAGYFALVSIIGIALDALYRAWKRGTKLEET